MKKLLWLVPDIHNWLSDRDFIWWPFSFLRPPKNELISFQQTLLMTGCFGGLSFVMFTAFAVVNNMFSFDSAIWTFIGCFGGFFAWFNLITKPLWNLRAKKLKIK